MCAVMAWLMVLASVAAEKPSSDFWLGADQTRAYMDLSGNESTKLWAWMGEHSANQGLPNKKGNYLYYRHEQLAVWFGPYSDQNQLASDFDHFKRLTSELHDRNPERYGNARAVRIFAPADDTIAKLARNDPKALELLWVLETYDQLESVELADKDLQEAERQFDAGVAAGDVKHVHAVVTDMEKRVRELELTAAGADEGFTAASVFGTNRVLLASDATRLKEEMAGQLARSIDSTLDPSVMLEKLSQPVAVRQVAAALIEALQRQGISKAQAEETVSDLTELSNPQGLVSPSNIRSSFQRVGEAYLQQVGKKAGVPNSSLSTKALEAQTLEKIANTAEFGRNGTTFAETIREFVNQHAVDATTLDASQRATSPSPSVLARSFLTTPPQAGTSSDTTATTDAAAFQQTFPSAALDFQAAAQTGLNEAAAHELTASVQKDAAEAAWSVLGMFSSSSQRTMTQKGLPPSAAKAALKWAQNQEVPPSALGMGPNEITQSQTQGLTGAQTRSLVQQVAAQKARSVLTQAFANTLRSEINDGSAVSPADEANHLIKAIQKNGITASDVGLDQTANSSADSVSKALNKAAQTLASRYLPATFSGAGANAGGSQRQGPSGSAAGATGSPQAGSGIAGSSQVASGASQTGNGGVSGAGSTSGSGGPGNTSSAAGAGMTGSQGAGGSGGFSSGTVQNILQSAMNGFGKGGRNGGGGGGNGNKSYRIVGNAQSDGGNQVRMNPPNSGSSNSAGDSNPPVADAQISSALDEFAKLNGISGGGDALMRAAKAENGPRFDQAAELFGQTQARYAQALNSKTEEERNQNVRDLSQNLSKLDNVSDALFDNRVAVVAGKAANRRTEAYELKTRQNIAHEQDVSEETVRELQNIPKGFDAGQAAKAMVRSIRFLLAFSLARANAPDPLLSDIIRGDRPAMIIHGSQFARDRVSAYLSAVHLNTNFLTQVERGNWNEAADLIAKAPRQTLSNLVSQQIIDEQNMLKLENGNKSTLANELKSEGTNAILVAIIQASGHEMRLHGRPNEYLDGDWVAEDYERMFQSILGATASESLALESGHLDHIERVRFHNMLFNWGRFVGWDNAGHLLKTHPTRLQTFAQALPWDVTSSDVASHATKTMTNEEGQLEMSRLRLRLALLRSGLDGEIHEYEDGLKK